MVLTEGQSSEPDYINALKRLPHVADDVSLSIDIHPEHGVPLSLVQEAVAYKKSGRGEVDEFWCLFDVEWPQNHPKLREAIDQARANGIEVAVSNPCFELWLILHHRDCTRWSETDETESRSRELDGRPGKAIVNADDYMPLRHAASRRAAKLAERHSKNGTSFPDDNPSSGMYLFVQSVERGRSAS